MVYLFYTQPLSASLPSKTFRHDRVGQWRLRQRHSQQQKSVYSLPESSACVEDTISRSETSLEFLPPGAFNVGANHPPFYLDVTHVQGLDCLSKLYVIYRELFSRAEGGVFH